MSAAILLDLLHDLVAVLLASGERDQDVEHRRGERNQRVVRLHAPKYMSVTDICQGERTTEFAIVKDRAPLALYPFPPVVSPICWCHRFAVSGPLIIAP